MGYKSGLFRKGFFEHAICVQNVVFADMFFGPAVAWRRVVALVRIQADHIGRIVVGIAA